MTPKGVEFKKSSLSGLDGIRIRVMEAVRLCTLRGEINLVTEGLTLLDEAAKVHKLPPGHYERNTIVSRLIAFEMKVFRTIK